VNVEYFGPDGELLSTVTSVKYYPFVWQFPGWPSKRDNLVGVTPAGLCVPVVRADWVKKDGTRRTILSNEPPVVAVKG
jgi:hypothetical protein